ncbi:MAG TPA: hypothetical protein VGJ05_08600 [Fimbriiglobus sp.]|jgi:hypothetical protein
MAIVYSYVRLVIAGWLVMAGVAAQFSPSAASVERHVRDREQELKSVPVEQQVQWLHDRDIESARAEAYFRIFGVLLGGLGIGAALHEAAFLFAKYSRR